MKEERKNRSLALLRQAEQYLLIIVDPVTGELAIDCNMPVTDLARALLSLSRVIVQRFSATRIVISPAYMFWRL